MAVKRLGAGSLILAALAMAEQAPISIDYPADGSVFPPDFAAPTFVWRDAAAQAWTVEVRFADGGPPLRGKDAGRLQAAPEIDPRCVAPTNEPPSRPAGARIWRPDSKAWAEIRRRAVNRAVIVTITGFGDRKLREPVSRGHVRISISRDPVGAPIFYRDVPLMPSELEKGVIKPLAAAAVPLVAWRLRRVDEPRSRLLLTGLHTCANCHSFSRDGQTLGMDLDGPQNDKALYALANVKPRIEIRNEDVISWSELSGGAAGQTRIGFMSQVSPDGRYVVSTLAAEKDKGNYYVANFKDFRFLQVFYPTRGILVWYDRATGRRQPLPGADDPRYVHTGASWSPDGEYLVFSRAEAREPYPEGVPPAQFANDPNETQIQYDLYRIPFNGGRGGRAEPVAGASRNGMSNTFPKVSPDGRWIVFVQCANGQLMRPGSELYIVPAAGGKARRMRSNLPTMNSWHSFSPNGRWLVFASKGRTPYTEMFLTHIDENGEDSPPIAIENATAANRAVNIPEFVNISPDGLSEIRVPAADFYKRFDEAWELSRKGGRDSDAMAAWKKAVKANPSDAKARNNLAAALAKEGKLEEAIVHWRKALDLDRNYAEVHRNLGSALLRAGEMEEATVHLSRAVELSPGDAEARGRLGFALVRGGSFDLAIPHLEKAVALAPGDADARYNFGLALWKQGRIEEAMRQYRASLAIDGRNADAHNDLGVALLRNGDRGQATAHFRQAVELTPRSAQPRFNLGNALYLGGRMREALDEWRKGLEAAPDRADVMNQAAWVLATHSDPAIRNGGDAVRLASRAVALSGGREPAMLDTLAAAYAETGRFREAVETAKRAQALAAEQGKAQVAEGLRLRIAAYAAGRPVREP